ncbi:MAG: hypothetical protein PGN34_12100 [Methylobacterium frigidaeris]
MKMLLPALAAALLAVPAAAREAPAPPPSMSGDVDATGTVTPADPALIPDDDSGNSRDPERPSWQQDRSSETGGPARELIPE